MRGETTRTAILATAATSHLGVAAAARLPEAGRTLQPVPALGISLGRRPPEPIDPGLLVAGTIALMGALRVRRRLGA